MKRRLVRAFAVGAALFRALSCAAADQSGTVRGKDLFDRRCAGCHALDRNKTGPKLHAVYGRMSASVEGFPYSDALRKASVTWNSDSLEKWLADPDKFAAGNDMDFHVENPDERQAIIAYLKAEAGK